MGKAWGGPGILMSVYSGVLGLQGYKLIRVFGSTSGSAKDLAKYLKARGVDLRALRWEEDGLLYARTKTPQLAEKLMAELYEKTEREKTTKCNRSRSGRGLSFW